MHISVNELDLAWQLLGRGRFAEALDRANRVLAQQPRNVSALCCQAMASWRLDGDIRVAISTIKKAAALAPAVASIWGNLGTLQASAGDFDDAARSFLHAIELKADDTQAFYDFAQNTRFTEETPLLRQMLALHGQSNLNRDTRALLAFGLAKAFDDLRQFDKAMGFAFEANGLIERRWDSAFEAASFGELQLLAATDGLRGLPAGGSDSDAPIFIVGMNRSGTTLVETILSRHGDVYAGGERQSVPRIENRVLATLGKGGFKGARNAALQHVPGEWMRGQADAMLQEVAGRAGRGFRRFTDKQPENAVRLGLIARLFPKARVIYLRRHPLDVGISNFFLRFADGQGYAFRQDLLGARIREMAESMRLWKSALDLDILDVSYERLVGDPAAEIRRIVSFAGLDWDEACLTPEESRLSVSTSSQWQVRQPIHVGAVNRWRAYEPWIGPMIAAMGGREWIESEYQDGLSRV